MRQLEKHILRYGLLTSLGLISYFLLMRVLGLAEIVELRVLNAPIMFTGIYLMLRGFKHGKFETNFGYLPGIAAGFFTGMVTAIMFAIFIGVYLTLDPAFLKTIVAGNSNSDFLTPFTSSIVIVVEATASGFLFSYASMQFLKPYMGGVPAE